MSPSSTLEQAMQPDITVEDFNGNTLKTGTDPNAEAVVLVNVHQVSAFKAWMRSTGTDARVQTAEA